MIRENFDIDYYRSSLSIALPECSIQAQLEQGGQGIVFHAWHRVAERDLAVKVLAGGAFASLHGARRFRREVEIMSKMHHPNIVQTYDCGVFDGGLWYAMKFIEGIEISGWQVIERPTERKCVELFIKVCDALAYAHRIGYIHRDIKPNNIHVDAGDNPFILDFGLARPLPSEKRDDISAAGHPVGTLNYMSPEQVIGEELLGVQTDIYSLGVVMYEVLSGGQMPYPLDGEVIERRRHIIETVPKPIKVFNPKIDQDLSSIVCKCLEKHPADRYDSMDALQSDLRNWLAGDAVTARAGNSWYRWKKTARRHKWPFIVALIFVVTLLAGATSTTIMWQRADDTARVAHATLQVGGYLRDGSVERDQGRVDQAIEYFLSAVELGESLDSDDPYLQRHLYGAHHRLGELYLAEGDSDKALPHCQRALQITARMSEAQPSSSEWKRLRGFSARLAGELHFTKKDYEGARRHFGASIAIRRDLLAADRDLEDYAAELAAMLAWRGRAYRMLGLMADAWDDYWEAFELRRDLAEANPVSSSKEIDLVQSEAKLAVWCIVQKTPEHNIKALEWIDRAEARLSEMQTNALCDDRPRDCRRLIADLAQNRGIVERWSSRPLNP